MKNNNNKRIISLLAVFMMMVSFITPFNVYADESEKQVKNLVQEEKINVSEDGTIELQILATTDTHGRFVPYDYAVNEASTKGSLTQILTAVRKYRGQNPENTILVDAGDTIQDNSSALFLNDETNPMILAMNKIGYDVWTLGNHEFNYGVPVLKNVMDQFEGTILCGNVYNKDGSRLAAPYTIVERSGVKVGIIGMVTPNITRWDSANLEGYKVTNPIEETKSAINEIKANVDIIIAVDHMGEHDEYGVVGSGLESLLKECPEITAVVGGHAHAKIKGDYFYNGKIVKGEEATDEVKANGTLIVEPYKYARALSQINIKLTKKDGKYVIVDKAANITSELHYMDGVEADEELSKELEPFNKKAQDDANQIIGELKGGDLVAPNEINGIPRAQVEETAMIDLINEVQLHYGSIIAGKKVDVAAAAAFRSDANIKEGKIKKSDTSLIYKYDNSLYVLEMTGKQLKKYMEWSASYFNTYKDGDLTISFNPEIRGYNYDMFSGVNYEIDITKPAGQRIVNLTKDGKEVTDDEKLLIAVNNYRANSHLTKVGAVYSEGDELPTVVAISDEATQLGDARIIRDLIGKYIKEEKAGVITPEVNGNWKIVGNNWDKELRKEAVTLINEGKIAIPKSEDGRTPNVASVKVDDVIKAKSSKTVEIISLNDFHGNVKEDASEYGKNMGMAKVMNAIRQVKEANPDTLVVAAGDNYQGSAMSNLTHGAPVSQMFKEIGLTASAVGNHEFDWGTKWIKEWTKDGNFNFLATNIYDKNTGKPVEWAKPYKIVEKGGIKVAFIGFTTLETAYKTKAENVSSLEFRDIKEAAEEWVNYLKAGNAPEGTPDAIIALTHVGSFQNREDGTVFGEVVESGLCTVEGIDAVVSGHTHQTVAGRVNGIPVVQGYKNGRAMAQLSINIDENGKIVGIVPSVDLLYKHKSTLVAEEKGEEIYNKYDEEIKPITSEVVGYTDKDLTHDRYGQDPSVLGAIIADYMRQAAGVQIGITNGGGVRTSISAGDITMGTMYEVLPFDNFLVEAEINGEGVKRLIENGIGNENIGTGQYAGLIVEYDMDRPFGDRITSIKLEDGTPLEMDNFYTIVSTDFMFNVDDYAKGGDGYDFTGARNVKISEMDMRQATVEGFKKDAGIGNENVYVVKYGDTLAKIANKYGTTYQNLAKYNHINNPHLIFVDQKILIPAN